VVPVGTVCTLVVVLEGFFNQSSGTVPSCSQWKHLHIGCLMINVLHPDSFTVTDRNHSEIYKLNSQISQRLKKQYFFKIGNEGVSWNCLFARVLELQISIKLFNYRSGLP
jgi:hypothetical protein